MDEELNNVALTEDDDEERSGQNPWTIVAAVVAVIVLLLLLSTCVAGQLLDDPVAESQTVTVPDVVGLHRTAAITELEDLGFDVSIRRFPTDEFPPGRVTRQSPPAGTEASYGITVIIEVAENPFAGDADLETSSTPVIPNIVGTHETYAYDTLESRGYVPSPSYQYTGITLPGKVMSQSPQGNTPAEEGTVVYYSVSLGEAPESVVTVPDVMGLSQAAANDRIRARGLTPFAVYRPAPSPVGVVSDQWPAAGSSVPEGEEVYYVIGIR
jgi:serine/threonine-protein kinase